MRWGDLDAQRHVNNATYLDYLQEARVDFLLNGPPVLQRLLTTGVLVVNHQVEYLRPLRFHDEGLQVELWVDSVGGSRFVIGYEVSDGEVLAARARTGAVPFDLATNTLRRLTPEERAVLTSHLMTSEPLNTLPRVRWNAPDHRYPMAVRWSDLDSYGHVNNVKYFDYLQEGRIALITEALGWSHDEVWVVVRQDLEYAQPIDFRIAPYEVGTVVTEIGTRSFKLAAEIRDPTTGVVFATARSVVVGPAPLTETMKKALSRWSPDRPG
jgi:acyl-CoA thioester hydrolase